MKRLMIAAATVCAALPMQLAAQETIVVTGSRQDRSAGNAYFSPNNGPAAIGVTRKADYFVTPLYVSSDSRDRDIRLAELYAMFEETLDRADAQGIAIVAGRYKLQPVTKANMRQLPVVGGNRPDTNRIQVYARIPLRGDDANVRKTADRIEAFVKDITATGRSFIDVGTTGLAIDNPEQYRPEVVRHVAKEATSYASMFGNDYGVSIDGLDGELYWQQSSETEVFMYIDHSFTVRPK